MPKIAWAVVCDLLLGHVIAAEHVLHGRCYSRTEFSRVALFCNRLAIAALLLCIPFLSRAQRPRASDTKVNLRRSGLYAFARLNASRRRPYGAPILDLSFLAIRDTLHP